MTANGGKAHYSKSDSAEGKLLLNKNGKKNNFLSI